jgi:hypothetical protein
VTPSEATISYGYSSLSRLGISTLNTTKTLNSIAYNHYLNDGTTLDIDTFTVTEPRPDFAITKPLDTHYLNSTWTQWTASTAVTVGSIYQSGNYVYTVSAAGTTSATTGPTHTSGSATNGSATFDYLGVYNQINDTSSVTMSDTTGTNGTRTVPYFVLNKGLATHYLNDGSTADTNSVTMTGSGGNIWLNAYTDAPYPFDSAYFANDSGNYTTGESTFTG